MESERKSKFNVKYIIIIVTSVIVILACFYLYRVKRLHDTYTIKLNGENEVTIYEGDEYVDDGYSVFDYEDKLVDIKCNVDGEVNNNQVGTYTIKYSINSFFKKNEVERKIIVLENPFKNIQFTLKDESEISIEVGTEYIDSGFICLNNNVSCDNDVKVNNEVNPKKIGQYKVIYSLTINDKTQELVRNVNVGGNKYSYTLSDDKLTNKDISINFISNIPNEELESITLPDNNVIKSDKVDYLVKENGTYKFVINKLDGTSEEYIIEITNIDKKNPNATCFGTISNNITTLSVNATDENGISKYIVNNEDYTTSNIQITGKYDNLQLEVFDNAGNVNKVNCNIEYEKIFPNNSNKIIDTYESDTLKYRIESSSIYRIVRVWVKDAYSQMKVGLGGNPTGLKTVPKIMDYEIIANNYTNKGLIAVNASFFTSQEYDTQFYEYNHGWRNTSCAPVLINNGNLIRDYTSGYIGTIYETVGLTRNYELKHYLFKSGRNDSYNIALKNNIVNDGVKYTYASSKILVENYIPYNTEGNKAQRNTLCQIDKNNYILVATTSSASLKEMSHVLQSEGCKTGINLDGGGSTTMYYKKNNNTLNSVINASRSVADALYFVEK